MPGVCLDRVVSSYYFSLATVFLCPAALFSYGYRSDRLGQNISLETGVTENRPKSSRISYLGCVNVVVDEACGGICPDLGSTEGISSV
jgi:putative NADH-flavin reductase